MTNPTVVMPNQVCSIESPQRARAADLMVAHAQRVEAVSNDSRFSPEGKAREIAASYLTTKRDVDALKADEAFQMEARKADLDKLLWGTNGGAPDQVIANRDADDRADKLDSPDAAESLYDRATQMGDTALARSVVRASHANGWQNVTAKHSQADPTFAARLQEHSSIVTQSTNPALVIGTAFAFGMTPPKVSPQVLREVASELGIG
jgi:hypothetical protein